VPNTSGRIGSNFQSFFPAVTIEAERMAAPYRLRIPINPHKADVHHQEAIRRKRSDKRKPPGTTWRSEAGR
jgi:hypothetical protein